MLPESDVMLKISNYISCKIIFPITVLLDEEDKSHKLIRHPSNRRRKEVESKNVIIITNDLEQENKLLCYDIDRTKDELSDFEKMRHEVSYHNDKIHYLYNPRIVDKVLIFKK